MYYVYVHSGINRVTLEKGVAILVNLSRITRSIDWDRER